MANTNKIYKYKIIIIKNLNLLTLIKAKPKCLLNIAIKVFSAATHLYPSIKREGGAQSVSEQRWYDSEGEDEAEVVALESGNWGSW